MNIKKIFVPALIAGIVIASLQLVPTCWGGDNHGWDLCRQSMGLQGCGKKPGVEDGGYTGPTVEETRQAQAETLISNAQKAMGDRDYQSAILLLEQADGLKPGNSTIADLLKSARRLRAQQIYDEARERAAKEERQRQININKAIAAALEGLDSLRQPIGPATAAPGFGAKAPGAGAPPGFGPGSNRKTGVVDPRTLITPEIYRAAVQELSRLKKKKDGFAKKLGDVRRWNKGLQRDDQEFEALRLEAKKDLMYEFLDHAPIGSGLGELKEAGVLTPIAMARIETGWEALKGVVNTWRGMNASEDSERVSKVIDGNLALRKAMMAIPLINCTENSKRWLDGFGKVYDVSAKFLAASAKDKKSFEEWATVFVDAGEAVAPQYVGIPVLAQHGAIRYAKYWSAKNAQASLADALSSGWNAERYLSGKVEVLNAQIAENERLVKGYVAVHGIPRLSGK